MAGTSVMSGPIPAGGFESARAINAYAYTAGSDRVFRESFYSPESESERHLLAHELAHVTQQSLDGDTVIWRTIGGGHDLSPHALSLF